MGNIIKDWLKEIEYEFSQFDFVAFPNAGEKETYIKRLTAWLSELVVKNYMIKRNYKKEKVTRKRQNVYWIDFGFNVGTEFNFPHFCVVIKEFNNTAIVVPISSEKESDPEWKNAGNLFIPIGVLDDLPGDKRDCYAIVSQIRTVSKQRLSDYYDKDNSKYISIMLNPEQTKKIFDAICSLGNQDIKDKSL